MKIRLFALLLAGMLVLGGCNKIEPNQDLLSSSEPGSTDTVSEETSSEETSSEETSSEDSSLEEPSTEETSSEETSSEDEAKPQYPVITSEEPMVEHEAIVTIGDAGFEYYTYVPRSAGLYAAVVNDAATRLKDVSQVYTVIIPTSVGITLPDQYVGKVSGSEMKEPLEELAAQFSEEVTNVPLYDALMNQRDDYIYFRTDHHWTARGAFYAYREFCNAKGIEYYPLSVREMKVFDGFRGSFYRSSGKIQEMKDNPDYVEAFYPVGENIKLVFTNKEGKSYSWPMISDMTNASEGMKYDTFAASDNPYTVIENADITDGSSCIILKESFGNALIPFLSDHYQTIYEVDYRYYDGSVISLAKEKQVDDIIFANNISMTRSDYLIGKLANVLS